MVAEARPGYGPGMADVEDTTPEPEPVDPPPIEENPSATGVVAGDPEDAETDRG